MSDLGDCRCVRHFFGGGSGTPSKNVAEQRGGPIPREWNRLQSSGQTSSDRGGHRILLEKVDEMPGDFLRSVFHEEVSAGLDDI